MPFPPNIARDTDEIEISRTWSFTSADRLQSN
jgi:protein TonB